MATLAILAAVLALTLSAYLYYRVQALQEDLRYAHRALRTADERLEATMAKLREDVIRLQQTGTAPAAAPLPGKPSWFTPYMTIQDALNLHPGVKQVLAGFHIGGCSSCSVSTKETLEQAAAGHGVSLAEMLAAMNALMDGQPEPTPAAPAAEEQARLEALARALPPAEGGRVLLGISGSVPKG